MNLIPRSTDVFVIGGGPAGLAAAIAARQRGFDVTVADCFVPPIDKACGEGIMPDGVEAARALGVELEGVEAQAFRGIRFCDPRTGAQIQADFPHGHGLGMRRTSLHRLMVNRALDAGVRLVWGVRVTGIDGEQVFVEGRTVRTRWIVGADGGQSPVRRWAGLDTCLRESRRFGFRRHYTVEPWSQFMEVHWGDGCQLYITPVAPDEVCVVSIATDFRLRLEDAMLQFPEISRRLGPAVPEKLRGGVSASRVLKSVYRDNVALVGDASGSVDAITGEGLCLLFQHGVALASALEQGDLAQYQIAHHRIGRRPALMARLMLLLDRHRSLRSCTMRAMDACPQLFSRMLALHVGEPVLGWSTQ